jgi:ureidoglycolate lyase
MPPSIPSLNLHIKPTPLTPKSFSKFGTLIQNPAHCPQNPTTAKVIPANQGSALKYVDISHVTNFYPRSPSKTLAKPVMNMFVCSPRKLRILSHASSTEEKVIDIRILERHPFTPQTFIPLGLPASSNTKYLIIVAPTLPSSNGLTSSKSQIQKETEEWPRGPGLPDLSKIQAFLADGSQAITYGPGTWHAPMVVIGEKTIDFVVVQWANGVADEDCQEVSLQGELTVGVDGFRERAKL